MMRHPLLPTIAACAAFFSPAALCADAGDLQDAFRSPPPSARPWVYWFFMDGNMTRQGMTADLEAMARAGIGGVIMMEVNVGIPRGPVAFMSPEWRMHFKHAVSEAQRLGLQITLNAGPGWTGSGGPWVTPGQSMQHLVAAETNVAGPAHLNAILPQPVPRPPYFPNSTLPDPLRQAKDAFYRDVAVLAFPSLDPEHRISDIDEKALYLRHPYTSRPGTRPFLPAPAAFPGLPSGAAIATNLIVDLTPRLGSDGRLAWEIPQGRWTLLRLGRTSTGANTRPAPVPGLGLECDKFDKAALDAHFNAYVAPLLRDVGQNKNNGQSGWTMLHIDSWEMGAQNWSASFAAEFLRRRGYHPLRYLPVLTGRAVESIETSERFLWDLRQTAQELVVENHAQHLRDLAGRHGLGLSIEPYDMNPCADMTLGTVADVPMCEFWLHGFNSTFSVIEAASIAHTCGRPIVAAEAFTSDASEAWQAHPASMKALGDWAFCSGVNRIVFHRYQHQPWLDRLPGMTMGPYGVHWERTQTWWNMSAAYHQYLARCQFLLRRGIPVADVLFLCAEGSPHVFRPPSSATRGNPPDPVGHSFDGCAPETLMARVSVEDGRLKFPDGMSYRVLVLPERDTMTPALLRKIAQLVRDGATIIGPPPKKSPSLGDYPGCDDRVRTLVRELWGDIDGTSATARTVGKGRVIWRRAEPPQARVDSDNPIARAKWIWHKQDPRAAPVGTRAFRRTVAIEDKASVDSAWVFMTADNAFTLSVNGRRAGGGESFHKLFGLDATPLIRPGTNTLEVIAENGGDAPNPAGLIGSLLIRLSDGRTLTVSTDREWRSAAGPAGEWTPAAELGPADMAPWKLDPKTIPPEPEQYGNFKVVTEELTLMGVPPDFRSDGPIRHTHRCDGTSDIYFVANAESRRVHASCTFRVASKSPELWDPLTGAIRLLPEFHSGPDHVTVPIRFEPHQSWFVVFRPGKAPADAGKNFTEARVVREIPGPWDITFDSKLGGPKRATLRQLADWSQNPDDAIRFYSGTAVYRTTFALPEDRNAERGNPTTFLDLGTVHNLARVRLNGRDCGTAWCAPWHVDVTGALKPSDNQLEIEVVNLWPNRLIGDEQFPDDSTPNGAWNRGPIPAWPEWLLNNQPRPEPRRITFATFKHWKKDSPLLPAGLLGPVTLRVTQ